MAYFRPLEYSPYEYTPQHRYTVAGVEGPSERINNSAYDPRTPSETRFQDYSGQQFQSLFDAVNKLGTGLGTYTSGQAQEQQAAQAQQSELARQAFQASLPQAPQMNFQQSPQPIYTGGGWGQQSPMVSSAPMTYRGQSPSGMLGTTNRGSHGGILGGSE